MEQETNRRYLALFKKTTSDWISDGGNIWHTLKQTYATIGDEILTEPSLNNNQSFWHEYQNKTMKLFLHY